MAEHGDNRVVVHPEDAPNPSAGGGNPEGNDEEPGVVFERFAQGRIPPAEVALFDRIASWFWTKIITIGFNTLVLCLRVLLQSNNINLYKTMRTHRIFSHLKIFVRTLSTSQIA